MTKGAGSGEAGLAMAFKLLTMAQKRWRKINSAHLTPLVLAGAEFPDGKTRVLPDLLTEHFMSNTLVEATFNWQSTTFDNISARIARFASISEAIDAFSANHQLAFSDLGL